MDIYIEVAGSEDLTEILRLQNMEKVRLQERTS